MSPSETNPEPAPTKGKRRFLPMVKLAEWDHDVLPEPHECTSSKRASFMFKVAVCSLLIIGLISYHGISGDPHLVMFSWWLGAPLLILWTIIVLEGLLGMAMAHDHHWDAFKRFLLVVLCPPIRAVSSPAYPNKFVWLPKHGWLSVGKLNFERTELRFALPMLGITLLVLPLLGLELLLGEWLEQNIGVAITVHIFTAIVWFGFALELIVMLSLTDKKLAYCKEHWVNLAIILLPLFAIFRMLRVFSFMRIGKATKLLRAYRMRGIVARTTRLAMVFNLIERLMERNPEKYLQSLEDKVLDKKAEIQAMEEKMDELRERIAKEKEEADADAAPTRSGEAPLPNASQQTGS